MKWNEIVVGCLVATVRASPGGGGPGLVLLGIFGGCVLPGSPNPDLISDQKKSLQTRPLKSISIFGPGLWAEIMSSLLRLERKPKIPSNAFRIRISYSFGIETTNTFIHSSNSLENHTRIQTKMDKVYTRFQTKKAQNPYPLGQHVPIWLI